jgi:hypothetical protein
MTPVRLPAQGPLLALNAEPMEVEPPPAPPPAAAPRRKPETLLLNAQRVSREFIFRRAALVRAVTTGETLGHLIFAMDRDRVAAVRRLWSLLTIDEFAGDPILHPGADS